MSYILSGAASDGWTGRLGCRLRRSHTPERELATICGRELGIDVGGDADHGQRGAAIGHVVGRPRKRAGMSALIGLAASLAPSGGQLSTSSGSSLASDATRCLTSSYLEQMLRGVRAGVCVGSFVFSLPAFPSFASYPPTPPSPPCPLHPCSHESRRPQRPLPSLFLAHSPH